PQPRRHANMIVDCGQQAAYSLPVEGKSICGGTMRYLILGAGALGGFFGSRLIKGGADVTFLVRPGRAAQLQRDGLVVNGQDGDVFRSPVKIVQQGQIGGPFDVVLLTCKAYDLDSSIAAIAPAVGVSSVILPVL